MVASISFVVDYLMLKNQAIYLPILKHNSYYLIKNDNEDNND